jgi:Tfp pilus assembly protein PilN
LLTGLVLLAALLALGAVAWCTFRMALEQQALETEISRVQGRADRVPRPIPKRAMSAELLRQIDATTARLNTPWSDVLNAIERNASDKVALLTLEPDANTGTVALTAEGSSLENLLAYAEALGSDPVVASVRMAQHELRVQDAGQPVRLTLSVSPSPLQR